MTTSATDVETLVAAEAIRRLLAEYCHTCDDGRFAEFAQLFCADATFEVMGMVHAGRDAIAGFMVQAQPPERRGKHVISSSVIDVDAAAGRATAVTDYLFLAPVEASQVGEGEHAMYGEFTITSSGRYHDEVVRDGDRWRFARRRIVFFSRP